MKIYIAAVGKLKAGPEKDLCDRYKGRLGWTVQIIEAQDEEDLLTRIPEKTARVMLDERGQQLGSQAFAEKIQKMTETHPAGLTFLIGGAEGFSEAARQQAHLCLSLGLMTWPHLLVRGLLMEQLYRAQQILKNHPYHKA